MTSAAGMKVTKPSQKKQSAREMVEELEKLQEPFERELRRWVEGEWRELGERFIERANTLRQKAQQSGFARARKKGIKLGGARNKKKFDRKRIQKLARQGYSQTQIAKKLKCSQPTVSNILKSRRKK